VRPVPALLSAAVAALALAGCSAQSKSKAADDYSGDQKAVATIVDDLVNNASKKDGKAICDGVLARSLVDQLQANKRSCADIVNDQLDDASNFDLKVKKVTVTGNTATVATTSDFGSADDSPRTLKLVKQDNDWRISGIEAASAPTSTTTTPAS
jgi:hypothetical protein